MQFLTPFTVLAEGDELGPISHLTFSKQGLLAIGEGWRTLVWDLSQEEIPDEAMATFPSSYMPPIAWSWSGERLAVGQDQGVAIYDLATKAIHLHPLLGVARVLAWSPDDTRIAGCSDNGLCHLWQPTGEILASQHFSVPPQFLLWLPDGRIATNPFTPTSSQWQVQIWDEACAQVEQLLDDGERRCDDYTCAAVSPMAEILALGTRDGWMQMWQVQGNGATRLHHLPFHAHTVQGLAWSPDGTYLASGAADGHVAIWNTRGELCFHLCCRRSGDFGVRDVSWWRDLLAVGDDDGHVELYRIPRQQSTSKPASANVPFSWHLLR